MGESIVSVRVDSAVHEQMRVHGDINWSGVIRQSLLEKLEHLERIDQERARQAAQQMDKLRRAKVFDKGKTSEELIREWREKRK